METYRLIIGVGIIVNILGLFLLSTITIYNGNFMRTAVELAFKLAILGAGVAIYKKGVSMRDETRSGR